MPYPPPPGWYPDPGDRALCRWWTGWDWGPYTAPVPTAPTPMTPTPMAPARRGRALDAAVARMRHLSPQRWGAWPVLIPLLSLVGLVIASGVAVVLLAPDIDNIPTILSISVTAVFEVLLGVSVWLGGRRIAARNGGWAQTFGLRRPRWRDLGYAGIGLIATFAARIAVGIVAAILSHGKAAEEAQNLDFDSISTAGIVLLVVLTVLWAPFIEELLFRGILLRTFMRRLRFWPAALWSSAIFAIAHTYEVDTLTGAATLAASVACLAIVNSYLNRWTDSLVAGMLVHAASNLVAVVVIVAQANG
jgi:membrane protease YdiL (CAAX protease family)